MKLQTYNDIEVKLIRSPKDPAHLIKTAMNLTMKKQIQHLGPVSKKSLRFLMTSGHTSLLEHIALTFTLEGISRSLLAQLTRHRMSSFTSASQHYADYSDMPMIVHPESAVEFEEKLYLTDDKEGTVFTALDVALMDYNQMVENGVPIYEARQVLPNACAVNLIWTVNLRSLMNFFDQRLCKRNVAEMQTVAMKAWDTVNAYWPDYADLVGPACYTAGKCNQGRMTCGQPYPQTYQGDSNDE